MIRVATPVTRENNIFQHLDVLRRNRAKRTHYGEVFVEGVSPIKIALDRGLLFRYIAFAQGARLSDWAEDLLDSGLAEENLALAPRLMKSLSDKEETSELIAVVKSPMRPLQDLTPADPGAESPNRIIIDRPGSPGNLGATLRSCDAFGVGGVVIHGHGADPYDPRTIRASVGTVFALPIAQSASGAELREWLAQLKRRDPETRVVGTSARGTQTVSEADLRRPLVIIVGNEATGMSEGLRDLTDTVLRIPIRGAASSINVAAATSIVLYEIERQSGLM